MSGSDKPLLSICCLGYCHAGYLSDAIQSISDIGYDNVEVIVVDDGSTDDSVVLLNTLSETVSFKMTVIAQENTGNIGLNFNTAFKAAQGDLVIFLSLDDVFNPVCMRQQVEMMTLNADLAFVASSKTVSIDNEGYVTEKASQLPLHQKDSPDIDMLLELEYSEFGSFFIQSAVFRKAVIDAVGGFDDDMTGDDIVLRTKVFRYLKSEARYSFAILKQNSFFYRLHGSNVHRNFPRQIKTVTEYLDRYWLGRSNPPMLIDWACSYISDHPFDDYVSVFSLNGRAASLLKEPDVQAAIRSALEKEVSFKNKVANWIYRRAKMDGGKRRITLFGFIRFEYKRAAKSNAFLHYSEYKA
ncbi:MAG TPA: hypothetical protein DDY51_13205 [Erwinia persicina]|nr:hypothetical protein [Erwinia persicina]